MLRLETLLSIAKASDDVNASLGRIAVSLDIYSGSVFSDKNASYFDNSDACRLLPPVPYDTLMKLHNDYNIAFHVEVLISVTGKYIILFSTSQQIQ